MITEYLLNALLMTTIRNVLADKQTTKNNSNTDNTSDSETHIEGDSLNHGMQTDDDSYRDLELAISQMKEIQRECDFRSLIHLIGSGRLSSNIALHLILDVAAFLSKPCVRGMRYSPESVAFLFTVKKCSKVKASISYGVP